MNRIDSRPNECVWQCVKWIQLDGWAQMEDGWETAHVIRTKNEPSSYTSRTFPRTKSAFVLICFDMSLPRQETKKIRLTSAHKYTHDGHRQVNKSWQSAAIGRISSYDDSSGVAWQKNKSHTCNKTDIFSCNANKKKSVKRSFRDTKITPPKNTRKKEQNQHIANKTEKPINSFRTNCIFLDLFYFSPLTTPTCVHIP